VAGFACFAYALLRNQLLLVLIGPAYLAMLLTFLH
jgi:hypothetical protein